MTIALESGADDVSTDDDGVITVTTPPDVFSSVKLAMEAQGLKAEFAEVSLVATTEATLSELMSHEKMSKLQDMLEDLDDVQNVYSNAYIPEDILEKLMLDEKPF